MNTAVLEAFQEKLRLLDRTLGLNARSEATWCGVTLPQCHILMALGLDGQSNLKNLSEKLGLDKSTLSRTIDGLVAIGLVERAAGTRDRRSIQLQLSQQGREIFDCIKSGWTGFCRELLDVIPDKKHTVVLEGLSLLLDAVQKSDIGKKLSGSCCTATGGKN